MSENAKEYWQQRQAVWPLQGNRLNIGVGQHETLLFRNNFAKTLHLNFVLQRWLHPLRNTKGSIFLRFEQLLAKLAYIKEAALGQFRC